MEYRAVKREYGSAIPGARETGATKRPVGQGRAVPGPMVTTFHTCQSVNKAGNPCGMRPLTGQPRCIAHAGAK